VDRFLGTTSRRLNRICDGEQKLYRAFTASPGDSTTGARPTARIMPESRRVHSIRSGDARSQVFANIVG
jgi:hypothetical protein